MIDYARWNPPSLTAHDTEPSGLTPMQRNVFWLVACGQKTAAIASTLFISPRTVEAHKKEIQQRIPGLKSFVGYGALASEIIARLPSPAESPHPGPPAPHRLPDEASAARPR